MHLLNLRVAVNIGKTEGPVVPGEYLVQDLNAFEIALGAPRGSATIRDSGWNPWLNQDSENVLIMRSGSFGDLVRITPVLQAWKKKTGNKVNLCCLDANRVLFDGTGIVDKFYPYPLPFSMVNCFSQIISLESTVELDHEHHITDVFAKALGVETPLKNYRPIYVVSEEEKAAAEKHIFKGRPTIGLHMCASTANRNYPLGDWLQVMMELERREWGVVLFGIQGQLPPLPKQLNTPFIRDLSTTGMSLRQSVAVLSWCNALIGVDSSFLHFAAALEVPAIGLFGPFKWQTRTGQDPFTTSLMGTGPCAGCSWHAKAYKEFPPNMPCTAIQQCVVLDTISPDRIITKAMLLKP